MPAPASDGKPAADAATDGKAAEKAPAAVDFKLPEGFQADAKAVDSFKALATEFGLDGPKAQKLVDFYVGQQQQATATLESTFDAQKKQWVEQLTADKDFGGANLAKTVASAQKALLKYGGPEVAAELHGMGLGDHPGLVRLLARVGQAMADDSTLGSAAAPGANNSDDAFLRALYPNSQQMFSKKE